jgi:hypothetical protein
MAPSKMLCQLHEPGDTPFGNSLDAGRAAPQAWTLTWRSLLFALRSCRR